MKRTRTKKNLRQQAEEYWTEYWNNYPYFEHDSRYNAIIINSPRTMPAAPKLKRNIFYPKEFSFHTGCPKEWNKIYHIRPIRRATKRMTEASYIRGSSILNIEDMSYMAEERLYPKYRKHVYYW